MKCKMVSPIQLDPAMFKAARETAGLSIMDVARATGITRGTIWRIENSDYRLSADMLLTLSKLYKVDPRAFIMIKQK